MSQNRIWAFNTVFRSFSGVSLPLRSSRIGASPAPPSLWLPCAASWRILRPRLWTLKAREEIRSHVEGEIRTAGADLDVTTLRRSSPYSLVCRKNSASYDRRVAQRHKELADIRMLKGMEDTTTT